LLFFIYILYHVVAGHPKHEWTSYSSFESVFKFFDEQYRRRIAAAPDEHVDGNEDSPLLFPVMLFIVDETDTGVIWQVNQGVDLCR